VRATDRLPVSRVGDVHPRSDDVLRAGACSRKCLKDDLDAAFGLPLRVRIAGAIGPDRRRARHQYAVVRAYGPAEPDGGLERRSRCYQLPGIVPAAGPAAIVHRISLCGAAPVAHSLPRGDHRPPAACPGAVLAVEEVPARVAHARSVSRPGAQHTLRRTGGRRRAEPATPAAFDLPWHAPGTVRRATPSGRIAPRSPGR
jgi:hypothetical protein